MTIDRSDVYAKGQGLRSEVKVTEVKTLSSRFGPVTPVLSSHMEMECCTKLGAAEERSSVKFQGHKWL